MTGEVEAPNSARSQPHTERSERFAELQKRTAKISMAVGSGTPLVDILRMVRDAVTEVAGFDRAGVMLYDARRDVLEDICGAHGEEQPEPREGSLFAVPANPQSPAYRVAREEADVAISAEPSQEPGDEADHPILGTSACAVAALRLGTELVGLIWADNRPTGRPIESGDLDLLAMGARQLAVAVLAARVASMNSRQRTIASRLAHLGQLIASEADLDVALRVTRDTVLEIARLDRVGIFLRAPHSERFEGVWGTDRNGKLEDLHGHRLNQGESPDDPIGRVIRGEIPFILEDDHTSIHRLEPGDPMFGVRAHCVLPMRAGDETVGLIVGDNLITGAPLTEDDVEVLLPFAEQAAVAVRNARLRAELSARVAQLQHLGRIASAITANTELHQMMRLVRDGIVGSGLFDRAGVFLYDPASNVLRGVWGTDRNGKLEDISHNVSVVDAERGMPSDLVVSGRIPYSLLSKRDELGSDLTPDWMDGVHWHAVVPMRAGDVIVGCISVDNLMSDRPITEADVELLLPFAEQAAAAVRAGNMSDELRTRIAHLEALSRVAATIAAQTDLREMLRMVRNAIVDSGMFDRAGVWLFDPSSGMLTGTWGTDRQGGIEDLWDQRAPLDPASPIPMHRVVRGEVEYSLIVDRAALGERYTPETMQGVRAHAVVPMRAGDAILGCIGVDNLLTNRPITHRDVQALLPFAEHSAVAVQKARLFAEAEAARRDLEKRVEQRTAELVQVSEEMAAFTYTLSHDLKAPVRAAHGFTCSVLEQYGELLPPEGRRDLERVRTASRRMGTLIESLIALGRLGRSELARRRLTPTPLVREAIRDLRSEFPHAAAITVHDLPPCSADPDLLRMAFTNLIRNALEATRDATVAMIHVGYEDGAYYVRDNGVGFDQDYAHTLFDLFRHYRPAEETEGAGFGLTFVRRAVEMHGGRVWAEGKPNHGAVFRFTIGSGTKTEAARPPGVLTRSAQSLVTPA